MADTSMLLPAFKVPQITPSMVNTIIMGAIIATLLAMLFKWATNRLYVEIYEIVKGGYVIQPGRFRRIFDKKTNMHSLVAMMGKFSLPAFDSEDYQKVSGMPFIGIKRAIKLLKINDYTYYVLKPTEDENPLGEVKHYNSMPWVYAQLNKEVDLIINRGSLKAFMAYAAPSIVIIVCVVVMVSAIWTDRAILLEMVSQVRGVGQALGEVCKTWITDIN